jgi:hypothetical protein
MGTVASITRTQPKAIRHLAQRLPAHKPWFHVSGAQHALTRLARLRRNGSGLGERFARDLLRGRGSWWQPSTPGSGRCFLPSISSASSPRRPWRVCPVAKPERAALAGGPVPDHRLRLCLHGAIRDAPLGTPLGAPHMDTSSPNTHPSSQPTPNWMRAVPADQLPDQDRPRAWWGCCS